MAHTSREYRFDGFISYSHEGDALVGASLQHELARVAKPWYRRRALKVFRDANDLSVNPDLWSAIVAALDQSEFLILLASPEAAQSKWVPREIEHWLSKGEHAADRILIALTAGEIRWSDSDGDFDWSETDSLPESMRGVFRQQPLWVDLRGLRNEAELSRSNPGFFNGCARLVAAIRRQPLADLIGRDYQEHRRTLRYAWSAGITLLLLTIAAGFFAVQSRIQANEAETQRDRAVSSAAGAALRRVQVVGQREPSLARELMSDPNEFSIEQRRSGWALLQHRYDRVEAAIQIEGVHKLVFQDSDDLGRPSLLILASGNQLWHWRFPQGVPTVVWTGSEESVVSVSRDGRYLSSAQGGSLTIHEIESDQVFEKLAIGVDARQVQFVPGREALLVLENDGDLSWWSFEDTANPIHSIENWLEKAVGTSEQNEYVDITRELTGLAVVDETNVWSTSSIDYDGGEFHSSSMRRSNLLTESIQPVEFKHMHRTRAILAASERAILVLSQLDDRATFAPPELTLIDVNSGALTTYIDPEREIRAADVRFGEASIAAVTYDGTLRLLDGDLQDVRITLRSRILSREDYVRAAALSVRAEWAASATSSGSVQVIDARREIVPVVGGLPGAFVATLAIAAAGDVVAIGWEGPGSENFTYGHWHPETGEFEDVYKNGFVHRDRLYTGPVFEDRRREVLAADPLGGRVLVHSRTTGFAGSLEVLDGDSGALIYQLPPNEDPESRVVSALLEASGGVIAFENQRLLVWGSGGDAAQTSFNGGRALAARALPNGWALLTLPDDGSVVSEFEFARQPEADEVGRGQLWLVDDRERSSPPEARKVLGDVTPHQAAVSTATLPDGEWRTLAGRVTGEITLVDVDGDMMWSWNPGFDGPVFAVRLFDDGNALVTGSLGGSQIATFVLDILTQTLLYELRVDNVAVVRTAFAASGNAFVVATIDGRVWRFDLPKESTNFSP